MLEFTINPRGRWQRITELVTFDTAGGTGSGVCGIDLVFRIISNRIGGVRWCVRQSKARRDFDHDIALVNADAELDAIVIRRSDILLGHAALPFGRATQCIDNTGEFSSIFLCVGLFTLFTT